MLCATFEFDLNPLPPSDAARKQKKSIFEDLFRSVLTKFEKYHTSGNLKFNYFGIFQSLKLRYLMGKILRISLKVNFRAVIVTFFLVKRYVTSYFS